MCSRADRKDTDAEESTCRKDRSELLLELVSWKLYVSPQKWGRGRLDTGEVCFLYHSEWRKSFASHHSLIPNIADL